jgi:hypothetical protein
MKPIKKPTEPQKTLLIPRSTVCWDISINRKIPLEQFLVWIKEEVPASNVYNVKIGLDAQYDNNYYGNELSSCDLMLTWEQEIPNPKYDAQLKQYQKKLAKWQAQQ